MNKSEEVQKTKADAAGPWESDKPVEQKHLRQPKTSRPVTVTVNVSSNLEMGDSSGNQNNASLSDLNRIVENSILNVEAAEFIPKTYGEESQCPPEPQPGSALIPYLKDQMAELTMCPGRYQELVDPLRDTLAPFMSDPHFLTAIVDAIVEESVTQSNFRYNGARLCCDLNKIYGQSFRTALQKRCSEEHREALKTLGTARAQGFAMLLAELYLQLTSDSSVQDTSLCVPGPALVDLLQHMAGQPDQVKTVCQVVKLCGAKLDERCRPAMDEVFRHLQAVGASATLDSTMAFLVNNVLELRRTNWGVGQESAPIITQHQPQPQPPSNVDTYRQTDPVLYGPDGLVMTEEETSFLHDSLTISDDTDDYLWDLHSRGDQDDDSMDEETCAAYEQFLAMTVNSQGNQHSQH